MLNKKTNLILTVLVITLITSCANKKKIIYFQGEKSSIQDQNKPYSALLKNDDLLAITVMALEPETAKPFNLNTFGTNSNTSFSNNQNSQGYLIDANVEIEFPVIGKIKVSGLNRSEASSIIKDKLKEYIKDPMVNINIINFKITILGDVNKPGVYTIPNERITLIEAIGLAGDLNMSAIRKNVLVVRESEGKRTETRVDLTSKEIFNSPVYYLQQNDLIYVEQNRAKKNSSVINAASVSVFVSLTSLVLTLITLITR